MFFYSLDSNRGAQGLADWFADQKIGVAVVRRGALVDEHDGVAAEIVEESGGGIDVQRGASHDEGLGAADVRDGSPDGLVVQGFLVEDHVGLDIAAAGADGDAVAFLDVVEAEASAAVQAVVPGHRAVQFPDSFAARQGVEGVDVLGHHGDEFPLLFQKGQGLVGLVGLDALHQDLVAVEAEELLGVLEEEGVAEDGLRGIVVLLVVQTVHAPEIGDARFR